MRHDIALRGHAFALRPVERDDAAFMLRVRAQSPRFLNRGATTLAAQCDWIARYLERAGDYAFIVVRADDGRPHGMAAIYGVDADAKEAEWGRFVLEHGSPAAVEAALLVHTVGFRRLGLERLRCRTLVDNAQVVAFHDSCGLRRHDVPVMIDHDGAPAAAIEHVLDRDAWPAVRARLDRLAAGIASRVLRTAS